MEKNLEFWNKYKEVPANALKSFDNGRFKGTDINTMWRMKVLTETYGKCGFGWYFKPIKLWTEITPEGEIFAFAEIELFIKENGEWSMPISGTGGNKLLRNTKSGTSSSDEAYKMAVTDAIGVACRNLGIGADVYWENDKTKYTEEIKETKQKTIVKESSFLKMAKDLIAEKDYQNLFNYYKVNSWEEFTETQLKDIIKKKGGKV